MLKIAHRGASGHAPENTMKAFHLAFSQGADGMEFDIRSCKTGEPVIIHDATLKRTTNGRGYVSQTSLKELKKLDAGDGEQIPTLEELLASFAHKGTLFLEIKDKKSIAATAALVTKFAARVGYEKLPVIGFHHTWLLALKKINPNILIGATPPMDGMPKGFCAKAKKLGFWAVDPCIDTLTKQQVADARKHGLKIISWTANTPAQIAKARRLGVDAIMSDYPDTL